MDPLAELSYDFTPYRYGFNNPVLFSDASGLFESFFEAVNFLLENNKSGTVTPHLHGGFYVTIIASEFEGEKFYKHASMLETVEIKSNGKSGGNTQSKNDNLGLVGLWGISSRDHLPAF